MSATRTKRVLSIQPVAERGGSDRALARLARSLTEDGWDCHIALPGPSPMEPEFAAAGATLHVVPMRRITTGGSGRYWLAYAVGWPGAVIRLARLARQLDARVVHTNSLHSWYGWAAARLVGRPHLWHAREIVVQSEGALRLERWLCRHFAQRVVAISGAVAAQLDGRNVAVVFDEADPAEFHPGRAGYFRAAAGIADDALLVGAAGRVDTWKGLDVLLDAVPSLQAVRPGVEMVIAGAPVPHKDAYAAQLRERAARMPGVHWLGHRADIAEVIADLDVFVLPSTEPEPFGLVVVEALASGVPVVATAHGGPVEILQGAPDGTGRLVPPGDPARLAAAVAELLPWASSTASRRARPVRRAVPAGSVVGEFEALLGSPAAEERRARKGQGGRRPAKWRLNPPD